jgi:alpha-amylase
MACSRPVSSTKRGWKLLPKRAGTKVFWRSGEFLDSPIIYITYSPMAGGPGEVHSYFSPYGTPYDAAVTYFSVLSDLHSRLKKKIHLADDPFRFATGIDQFTGKVAWSLKGLQKMLEDVELTVLEYHVSRGDLVLWAATSLGDETLAERLTQLKSLRGEKLRRRLMKAIDAALLEEK